MITTTLAPVPGPLTSSAVKSVRDATTKSAVSATQQLRNQLLACFSPHHAAIQSTSAPSSAAFIEFFDIRNEAPGTCISDEVFDGPLLLYVHRGSMTVQLGHGLVDGGHTKENEIEERTERQVGRQFVRTGSLGSCPDAPSQEKPGRTAELNRNSDKHNEIELDRDPVWNPKIRAWILTDGQYIRIEAGVPVSWVINGPTPCHHWVVQHNASKP